LGKFKGMACFLSFFFFSLLHTCLR
jgi:hypothetical protein